MVQQGCCGVGGWWVTVMFPRQRVSGEGRRGREGKMVAWARPSFAADGKKKKENPHSQNDNQWQAQKMRRIADLRVLKEVLSECPFNSRGTPLAHKMHKQQFPRAMLQNLSQMTRPSADRPP